MKNGQQANKDRVLKILSRQKGKELSTGKLAMLSEMNYWNCELSLIELAREGIVIVEQKPKGKFWRIKA